MLQNQRFKPNVALTSHVQRTVRYVSYATLRKRCFLLQIERFKPNVALTLHVQRIRHVSYATLRKRCFLLQNERFNCRYYVERETLQQRLICNVSTRNANNITQTQGNISD